MAEITTPAFDRVAYSKSYYQLNKERIKVRTAEYQRKNRVAVNAYHRDYRLRGRIEAMGAYGGACECCGETEPVFLTIHHVEGNGNNHRKEVCGDQSRAGHRFYAWLKREGWPTGFAVRCWNCNSGAAMNGGVCPHEETRLASEDAM